MLILCQIIAIVLIMGVYDFVVGIVVGIVLACLNYVVQSSRTPAIRASYSGDVAESTVRRPRADRRYLHQVRRQIRVEKLSGMLFFGTIVAVEKHLRALIEDKAFAQRPVSFIVVDFSHVTGLDFSAAEGFQRINRILCRKHVKMVLSGVSFTTDVGSALANVGLLTHDDSDEECPPPEVFEDLNMALEACENHLLGAFYKHRYRLCRKGTPPISISTPSTPSPIPSRTTALPPQILNNTLAPDSFASHGTAFDPAFQSPRRDAQLKAATTILLEHGDTALSEGDTIVPSKWKHFAQPIKIMLQTFEDVSAYNEDFWHRAAPFLAQRTYPAGSVLYSRGDDPDGFYILEQGRLRAEYDLEQGNFYEVILPGTTCGELPFFSETDRTGTVAAENDSVAWLLTREKYRELEEKEPGVARELLKVGLKLTKERMDAITS
jgi:SulP family sulfate permease